MNNRKIKNIMAAFAVSAMAFSSTICASAAVPEGAFDADYYATVYEDLQAVFGNDEEALYSHYLQNGISEGRFGSPDFDVRVYREQYPDLEEAFGDNWDAYFWHYVNSGASEGRTAVPDGAPDKGLDEEDTFAENGDRENTAEPKEPETDPALESYFDNSLENDAFNVINQYRLSDGKDALSWSDSLYQATRVRAEEITELFDHTRPNAEICFTVLNEMKISYRYAGENIAAGQTSGLSVATAWYNSESHRNNMLSKNYKKAAIACYVYDGRCYWVNMFTN